MKLDTTPSAGNIPSIMARSRAALSDQLRQAITNSDLTRYRICVECDIDQGTMSKFMVGQVGMSLETLDRLVAFLGLELVKRKGG